LAGELAQQALRMLLPALKVFSGIVIAAIIIFLMWYYLFVLKKQRVWIVAIKEMKSDGKLHTILFDKLVERKYNYGKKTFFWLKRCAAETTPPPDEIVDRVNRKDYATYIKIRHSYIPLQEKVDGDVSNDNPLKQAVVRSSEKAVAALRDKNKYRTGFRNSSSINERFVYVPINYVPHVNVGYHSMDYDIDMMRINAIDNLEQMFSSRKDFWQKWGMLITIGAILALVIVVTYFTYEHAQKVIAESFGNTREVVSALEKVAQAFGSSKPPA